MKYPKKADQAELMGLKCSFDAEYYRSYLKKKIGVHSTVFLDDAVNTETIPVKWKKQKHKIQTGWIIGFGFCFDGFIIKEGFGDLAYKYFRSTKRINYVKVRINTTGPELKIPAYNIINW